MNNKFPLDRINTQENSNAHVTPNSQLPASNPKAFGRLLKLIRSAALSCAGAALLASASSRAATISFNFTGGLQGWTQIGSTPNAPWNSGGNAWGATASGSIYGYDADDGS